jgi:hypothetical protein
VLARLSGASSARCSRPGGAAAAISAALLSCAPHALAWAYARCPRSGRRTAGAGVTADVAAARAAAGTRAKAGAPRFFAKSARHLRSLPPNPVKNGLHDGFQRAACHAVRRQHSPFGGAPRCAPRGGHSPRARRCGACGRARRLYASGSRPEHSVPYLWRLYGRFASQGAGAHSRQRVTGAAAVFVTARRAARESRARGCGACSASAAGRTARGSPVRYAVAGHWSFAYAAAYPGPCCRALHGRPQPASGRGAYA